MNTTALILLAAVGGLAAYLIFRQQQTQVAVISQANNPVTGKTTQGTQDIASGLVTGILAAFALGNQIAQSGQKTT